MTARTLIDVRDLTKDYLLTRRREGVMGGLVDLVRPRKRVLRAVDRISFSIEAGEMVGYIGANGAGKSTTIKMLTGILTPTAGEVRVGGLVPYRQRQQYTRHIGVVFGQRTQLWWDLAVVESFRLLKKIYEVSDAAYAEQMRLFDDLLGVGELLDQPVRKLSLGQRMRCDLAAALLHRPTILFLDEPTIGLDVVAKEKVRSFLREARDLLGTTVILTTHDLGDIQQLCRRIIIIDRGLVLYDGTLEVLKQQLGHRMQLQLELREPTTATELARVTGPLPVRWTEAQGRHHTADFSRLEVTSAEIIRLVLTAHPVQDLRITEPDVEEVVRRIYREGRVLPGREGPDARPADDGPEATEAESVRHDVDGGDRLDDGSGAVGLDGADPAGGALPDRQAGGALPGRQAGGAAPDREARGA
ncbi:MAG: ATP-binding cassette domain-containing protein [Candidatus Krumholzibacteriia bacterium]